jgi:signal transduction histidine kinase
MPATLEDLKQVIALKDISDEHLQWILDRSEYEEYEDGTTIVRTGDPIDHMWFILEGGGDFYLDVNGKLVQYFRFENNTLTGGVGGLLPYSRMKASPGYNYAVGKVRIIKIHKKYFHDLEELNPDLIQRLIGYMTERARYFATQQSQQEKVSALGKLAAGIAHELNNPAAAINGIAGELQRRLKTNYQLTENLLGCSISAEHIKRIREMVEAKEKVAERKVKLTAMQRMVKEDEFADWFDDNGFKDLHHQAAETFSDAGLSIEDFESIRNDVGNRAFEHVLHWLENVLTSDKIIEDLDEASGRISKLVGAIKSHVHMDRTNDVQCTDLNNDIENTLTLMGYKLRNKNITVKKNFSETMPQVEAYVGELNQVWTNIIDNAIYAMEKNGELYIETCFNKKDATVKIVDNGSGIPNEILTKIFDPFFTTKKVGDGTGIGLDLVQRIVKQHQGEVNVSSIPGRTEFKICIPLKQNQQSHEPVKDKVAS